VEPPKTSGTVSAQDPLEALEATSTVSLQDQMEPSEASNPVTTQDQSSYIKIESLRGKNPTEITTALKEVCGGSTADWSIIARWASRFRDGRVA